MAGPLRGGGTEGLPVIYDNNFESDVIGSRMVSTILKLKSAKSEAHIELNDKCIHEKVGILLIGVWPSFSTSGLRW